MEFAKKSKQSGKHSVKLSGQLKAYILWPVCLGVLLFLISISLFLFSNAAGFIMLAFCLIYLIMIGLMLFYYRPAIMNNMVEFASGYSQVQRSLMSELSVPYALLDEGGRTLWFNDAMKKLTEKNRNYRKGISLIFPEIGIDILPDGALEREVRLVYNNRDFRVELKRVPIDPITDNLSIIEAEEDACLIAMYMFDETDSLRGLSILIIMKKLSTALMT